MTTTQSFSSEQPAVLTLERGAGREHTDAARKAEPLRVLHVINGEHYSGAERVQDLLALNLPQFGYEASFACVKTDRFPLQRMARAAELFDLPMRSRFDFPIALQLKRLIAREGFRLVHAHTPRSALVGRVAAAWAGVPMVYHVHSPTARDTTYRWRNGVNQLIEKLSLFRSQGLITVSESLGRHMQLQGYPEKLVSVVRNGVPSSDVLRPADPPVGEWQLGTVALFRPRKGLEVLLDAIAALRRQDVPVRLRAVGPFESPEYETEIHEHVKRLDLCEQIDWIGFTPDVPAELSRMDLFILPSLFGEGLPMVVLEAMATGVPVVGTRVEGVPEALDDGVTGMIAEPSDPDDLARCIRAIISGEVDWSILRDNGLQAHAQRFSALQMARGVAAVYDKVLSS